MEYLGFIGAIIALIIIVKVLAWPIKKIIKLAINVAIGVVLLFLFNYFLGLLAPYLERPCLRS